MNHLVEKQTIPSNKKLKNCSLEQFQAPVRMLNGNFYGTRYVMDACLRHNVRNFVYTSSIEAICPNLSRDDFVVQDLYRISIVMSIKTIFNYGNFPIFCRPLRIEFQRRQNIEPGVRPVHLQRRAVRRLSWAQLQMVQPRG